MHERAASEHPGRIVVGFDGSPGSEAALAWAADEARLRGATVVAVHAWMLPLLDALPGPMIVGLGPLAPSPEPLFERALRAAEHVTAAAAQRLEGTGGAHQTLAVEGRAAETLIDASAEADLLVVGSRGHGGFPGLTLGSVSLQCAHHARCPVVIIPPPSD